MRVTRHHRHHHLILLFVPFVVGHQQDRSLLVMSLIYAFQLVDAVKPTNEKVLVSHLVTVFESDISGSLQILKQHVVEEISFQGVRREDKGVLLLSSKPIVCVFMVEKWWRV
ncbi:hypothetical protein GQ457_03G021180 [Hibiscus cannabinus]